jgi:hypothetical protein
MDATLSIISPRTIVIVGFVLLVCLYLYHVNRALGTVVADARALGGAKWTTKDLDKAWEQEEKDPIDIRKFLPPKQGRRYIVIGGAGKFSIVVSNVCSSNADK